MIGNSKNQENIMQKLLKADYHGAILKVYKAKCESYVGIEGIVLQDTQRSFKIITSANKINSTHYCVLFDKA